MFAVSHDLPDEKRFTLDKSVFHQRGEVDKKKHHLIRYPSLRLASRPNIIVD